jgi:hypothetical protein
MTTGADPTPRFTSDMLVGLDEPVRRYFSHAIGDGAALSNGVRMAMCGRIKVGLWLPFTAEQTVDGRSFVWRARVGWGRLTAAARHRPLRGRGRQHRGAPARALHPV